MLTYILLMPKNMIGDIFFDLTFVSLWLLLLGILFGHILLFLASFDLAFSDQKPFLHGAKVLTAFHLILDHLLDSGVSLVFGLTCLFDAGSLRAILFPLPVVLSMLRNFFLLIFFLFG